MAASKWTAEQKAEALQLYRDHGPTVASERTGVPKATVASWARRAGVQTAVLPPPALEAAVETAALGAEQRRLELADGLLDDVAKLRRRLFEPHNYVHVVKVKVGKVDDEEGEAQLVRFEQVEQVQVHLEQPVPADQLRLAQSIVALIEKAQLLTGEATSREDGLGGYDLEQELRTFQAGVAAAQQQATP